MGRKAIGVAGLGNMGGNIARRLHDSGFALVLYDRSPSTYTAFEGMSDIETAGTLAEMASKLRAHGDGAFVWLMLPAGEVTNGAVSEFCGLLRPGDIVMDGSNSMYEDSVSNHEAMGGNGISYLDVGFAGGPEDILNGVALMIGGERDAFVKAESVFKAVSGSGTYGYVGASGSGHKTKLVHNMIFYGIFPVYAEGVDLLIKLGKSGGEFNRDEALRLLAASPPINRDILAAMAGSQPEEGREGEAPGIKVSGMVEWGAKKAAELGVQVLATSDVLRDYPSLSADARWIYSIAKKRITGH